MFKSRILDGVLMVLAQKQNRTSPSLKLYGPCLKCFGTNCTHSRIPGLNGEALFLELSSFFVVSANRRLEQIRIYEFVLYKFTYINLYVNLFFYTILYVQICTYELYTYICTCKFFFPPCKLQEYYQLAPENCPTHFMRGTAAEIWGDDTHKVMYMSAADWTY